MLREKFSFDEVNQRIRDSYEIENQVISSMPDPLVSVYLPTYQHANYICEAIESILMQETDFAFELIIGEDFSTDGTREIVYQYAENYPYLIRLITADYNVQQQANHMRCLLACRGKYIAICSGDDYWTDPQKLQKQADFMVANPEFSMCYHSYQIKKDGVIGDRILPVKPKDFSRDELLETPHGMPTFTKMVINIFQDLDVKILYKFHNDYPMNALLGTFGKCKFLGDIKPGVYRYHSGGAWQSQDPKAKLHNYFFLKMRLYYYFLEMNDEKSALICLESLRKTLEEHRYSNKNRKIFEVSRSHLEFYYRGIHFKFIYYPVVRFFNRRVNRLFGKKN
ncbi:MAG: glycosyltransferase [Balneolaceae bacterium]|nr:MAG: glycosyltransferase [Balneolaceae bacterium]